MSKLAFKVRFSTVQTREAIEWWLIRNTSGQWSLEHEHHSYDASQIKYAALFENQEDSRLFGRDLLGLAATNADSASWGSRVTSRLKKLFAAT